MSMIHTAEILCVGTELLLGDIVNTNAAFLSQQLAELGIAVYRHTVVGDNPARLEAALCAALRDSDLVITSGGLGPTYDDLTKETVAAHFGRSMYMDEHSLSRIEAYFHRTGRVMTDNNRKQAMMPVGACVFDNDYGTAPALALCDETKNKTAIMLPGPPSELIPLFRDKVLPYLQERRETVIESRNVYLFGIGESALETRLGTLLQDAVNPSVAPYCKEGEVRLRVTARAADSQTALSMCDGMIDRLMGEVGEYIYGVDVGDLEHAVIDSLHRTGLTLACAESCTGGLIAKRLTDVPGGSDVFLGGCVTYTNEIKKRLLGVREDTLCRYSAVSEQTAREMAEGVRARLGADVGVATTGIAGPGGGTEQIPVGTVYVAISTKDGTEVRHLSLSPNRSRTYIRHVAASHAFDMILQYEKKQK